MSVLKIEKLEDLFSLEEGQKIVEAKITRLTGPGENYGSLMLKVDLRVSGPQGVEEIRAVAKTVPDNEFTQDVFNTQITFRNEIGFYKHIVPILRNFQREHGVEKVIDFFPKYYGSRINLKNDDTAKVDLDAALVLENLKVQNFENLDRTQGFDLTVARMILTDLAHLHAVSLALKLQKPEVFDKEIQPFLSTWSVKESLHEQMKRDIYRITDNLEQLQPLRDRIHQNFDNLLQKNPTREPFATITHNDCWVNNTMIKVEKGKPVKSVLVDFQVCDYGSPAKDVLFFIFSSVKTEVVEHHYDHLIKFYHEVFISILKKLGSDISQFSFEAFLKELDIEAKNTQFGHTAFMLYPIFLPKEHAPDVTNNAEMEYVEPTQDYKDKLTFFIKEFSKRNWI